VEGTGTVCAVASQAAKSKRRQIDYFRWEYMFYSAKNLKLMRRKIFEKIVVNF
jgi:hypothetical protein